MKTKLIIASTFIVLAGGAYMFGQTRPIVINQPQPEVLVKGNATPVFVSAVVPGDVLQGSVNLLRIGADGSSSIIGQLQPSTSSPTTYAISKVFNEANYGVVILQVSAAIRGQLKRNVSPQFRLAISSKTIQLPPDPGTAGKATLAGIDSDHDGVRDDLQREIMFIAPESEGYRRALAQATGAEQHMVLSTNKHDAIQAALEFNVTISCLAYLSRQPLNRTHLRILRATVLNTPERLKASEAADALVSGQVITLMPPDAKSCLFDISHLAN